MKRQHHIIALCVMLVLMTSPAKAGDVFVKSDAGVAPVSAAPAGSIMLSSDAIQKTFGGGCHQQAQCGDLTFVDCGSAADGPAYYVKSANLELVMKCGGVCMSPPGMAKDDKTCQQCPPKEWTCGEPTL